MKQKIQYNPWASLVRFAGAIVILATLSAAALMTLFFLKPWLFLSPMLLPRGDIAVHSGAALVTSLVISGVGSLCMLALTKKLWWLLSFLVSGLSAGFLTLIGMAMGPGLH